jgi:hypothetical protein
MTDDHKLVENAAEEMGWKLLPNGNYVKSGGNETFVAISSGQYFDPLTDANHRDIFEQHLIDTGHEVEMVAPVGDEYLFAYSVDSFECRDANRGKALIMAAKAALESQRGRTA